MLELSVFIDESGDNSLNEAYHIVTLVMHDQSNDLADSIARYEHSLYQRGLPNIPFHAVDLLNGHEGYRGLDAQTRAKMLASFRVFFRHLPISYKSFVFKTREFESTQEISDALRRQLVNFIFDHLAYFQGFASVKIYYDGGQSAVTTALHKALDYALSRNAITYRPAADAEYHLSQAADYICLIELAELRYRAGSRSPTYEKFLGGHQKFKHGFLRETRAKHFE